MHSTQAATAEEMIVEMPKTNKPESQTSLCWAKNPTVPFSPVLLDLNHSQIARKHLKIQIQINLNS